MMSRIAAITEWIVLVGWASPDVAKRVAAEHGVTDDMISTTSQRLIREGVYGVWDGK